MARVKDPMHLDFIFLMLYLIYYAVVSSNI